MNTQYLCLYSKLSETDDKKLITNFQQKNNKECIFYEFILDNFKFLGAGGLNKVFMNRGDTNTIFRFNKNIKISGAGQPLKFLDSYIREKRQTAGENKGNENPFFINLEIKDNESKIVSNELVGFLRQRKLYN